MDDERNCPECDGHLSTAVGMGWSASNGAVLPWVLTCLQCNRRTGEDWTYGLDENRSLVGWVDAFMLEGNLRP